MENMVAVKWKKPGSQHHGVVHYVHQDIVKNIAGQPGNVQVLWPKKREKRNRKFGMDTESIFKVMIQHAHIVSYSFT